MSTKTKALPHEAAINLDPKARRSVVDLLNQQLANMADLHSQTKQAHWNVRGQEFFQLHKLFDEIAAPMGNTSTPSPSVRSPSVGSPPARCAAPRRNSEIPEFPLEPGAFKYVQELAQRYAVVGNSMRASIDAAAELGDAGTADLFTQISRDLDNRSTFWKRTSARRGSIPKKDSSPRGFRRRTGT
jgi:starvation-inducible DNA-binding protein